MYVALSGVEGHMLKLLTARLDSHVTGVHSVQCDNVILYRIVYGK